MISIRHMPMTGMKDRYCRIRMVSIGQMPTTRAKDQYYRIRMVDNIKVNIQQVYGPTTIKLAQCFCLAILLITFLLFQDFIKYLYRQIRIGCTTSQQCKHCKFFKGARMLVNMFSFVLLQQRRNLCQHINTSSRTRLHHCNVNYPIATSLRRNSNPPNSTETREYDVNTLLERQSRRTTSTRQYNIKTPLERQGISTTSTHHAMLAI